MKMMNKLTQTIPAQRPVRAGAQKTNVLSVPCHGPAGSNPTAANSSLNVCVMKPPFAFDQTMTVIDGFAQGDNGSRQKINVAVSTKGSLLNLQEHLPIKP